MKMVFRWFGEGVDPVSLLQISQVPCLDGVASSILGAVAGDVWPTESIEAMVAAAHSHGLGLEVIESVNVSEDIKLGLPSRDEKIANYIETMKRLSKAGIKVICYNFMPVLDWARSELRFPLPDGSNTMRCNLDEMKSMTPDALAQRYAEQSGDYELPGWEPERLKKMNEMLALYEKMPEGQIWDNLKYFLDAIIPTAEEVGISMAIHPDDPPWPIFGLPRIIISRDNIKRFLDLNKSLKNGLTLCTGSLGANPDNDVPAIIREFAPRIHFAHVRNLRHTSPGIFYESSHLTKSGSLDMVAIMKALFESGFDGYIRPDHGRMIWGETGRPGYGLYDRALGAMYLSGIWEALERA
ncbi:MAG: mannonate dehydratase [Clostridiales bacterium]|jgi:mannonate dehydratase|nr:mannonate dehydratase [Clostridiales bacterium]